MCFSEEGESEEYCLVSRMFENSITKHIKYSAMKIKALLHSSIYYRMAIEKKIRMSIFFNTIF